MYAIRLEIDLSNFEKRLKVLQEALQDLSPFWREHVIPFYDNEVQDIFDGQPWDPLKEEYRKRKERERPGKTILRYDDDYINSYLNKSSENHIQVINERYMEYGSSLPYARAHEIPVHATHIYNLPRRQVLRLIEHQEEIRKLMCNYLNELVKGV